MLKMGNENQINLNTVIIIVALLIFAIVVIPKLNLGGGFQFGSITDPMSLFDNDPNPECTFEVDDNLVCLGENVTGTLNAKSPTCYIGYNYNYGDWKFAGIINETSPGFYEESRAAPAIGHYEFAAICGTPMDFCRTNNVEVDVINCNGDGNGVEYTCGWVGEQCGGTCPDTHPLCVDMWYETIFLEGYTFCACINPDDETVHPDWKPDGQYHDPYDEGMNGEPTECIDTDPTQDVYLFGNCVPSSGGNNPDFCPTDFAVTQFACISGGNCIGMSMDCPVGSSCSDGVCVIEEQEFNNCYDACNGIISPEYSAGKLQSDLYFHPYDCYENSKVNCEFSSSLVRWLDYTYYDLDCCCWQCAHWE